MLSIDLIPISLGLIIGLVFGLLLQRGKLCTNSAFANMLIIRNSTLVKAIIVAVLLQMIGMAILSATGFLDYNPIIFSWLFSPFGGFIFGIGMVLASGCASGVCYKAGEGLYTALIAIVGFAIGGLLIDEFGLPIIDLKRETYLDDPNMAIPDLLGFNADEYWIIGLIIGILGLMFIAIYHYNQLSIEIQAGVTDLSWFKNQWPWWVVGGGVGIVGIIAFLTRKAPPGCGCQSPGLGMTEGIVHFYNLDWSTFLVLGTILGAFLGAYLLGGRGMNFKFEITHPKNMVKALIGGMLMGAGAMITAGCNVGHLMGGIPHLSIGSFITVGFMILGNWSAVLVLGRVINVEDSLVILDQDEFTQEDEKTIQKEGDEEKPTIVDTKGQTCPIPLLLTRQALRRATEGEKILIVGNHRPSINEISEYIGKINSDLINVEIDEDEDVWYIYLKYHVS
ncbi:MAG: YeeE/YedE thiosulfate transporter family protein [Candidatus Hodarchaeales archaeon]|jgi:TusA-related sulfurtransferase